MAVVSVREQHQRRRSSWKDGKETHVRVFIVVCDDPADGTRVAMVANDGTQRIPYANEELEGKPQATVTGIDAQPVDESDRVFQVEVEYSSTDAEQDEDDVHPLDRPPEVSWTNSEKTEPYFVDRTPGEPQIARDPNGNPLLDSAGRPLMTGPGKPVVNTAGDAFEQFLEREAGEKVITMVRNEAYHDDAEAEFYGNTVNLETVVIDGTAYPAGTLKLSPIQASRHVEVIRVNGQEEQVTYYKRTYTFKFRREGWRDHPLDVGTNEIVTRVETVNSQPVIVKKLRPIVDSAGVPVKRPWPLNGVGQKQKNPTDPPIALEFLPYSEVSWAALYF